MILHVTHRTSYAYGASVRDNYNEARLRPVSDHRQSCLDFQLEVEPGVEPRSYTDAYGNTLHQFEVITPHELLSLTSRSRVETREAPPMDPTAKSAPLGKGLPLPVPQGYFDYLSPSPLVTLDRSVLQEAHQVIKGHEETWPAALAVMAHVNETFTYQPNSTTVHTPMLDVFKSRKGVCQDFAHCCLGLCRSLGIASRYVSGYLYNGPGDTLKGAQASHAWVEVFIPPWGWVGLDPTNGQMVKDRHVKIAHGRDYRDVPPVKGTYRGTDRRVLKVEVSVEQGSQA